jgi:hypothetical protein
MRHGCNSLVQIEIRLARPWNAPRIIPGRMAPVYRLDYGQARPPRSSERTRASTSHRQEIIGDTNGCQAIVTVQPMERNDKGQFVSRKCPAPSGAPCPTSPAGDGFSDLNSLLDALALERDARTNIRPNSKSIPLISKVSSLPVIAGAKACGLGLQRRSRRRPRMRPLPDGPHEFAFRSHRPAPARNASGLSGSIREPPADLLELSKQQSAVGQFNEPAPEPDGYGPRPHELQHQIGWPDVNDNCGRAE